VPESLKKQAYNATTSMTLGAGMLFGSYEIVAAPGAGGMGKVHRACDTKLKRDIAIKSILQNPAASVFSC
jgi:hypothetical protein